MTARMFFLARITIISLAMLPAWLSASNVTLNEIVSSNGSTVADEDGSFEDWIEIHNAGESAVNLSGWGLTDSPASPFKWIFPDECTIGPDQYLLVWASNKDRRDPSAELHTNFAISASGETIVLTRPDSMTVDSVALPAVPRDTSYGRKPDGDPGWYYFEQPTPGAANTTPGFATLPALPTFSTPAGFHDSGFDLELATEPGWTIYYTLDGSDPDPARVGAGAEPYRETFTYTAPITVASRAGDPNVFSEIPTTKFVREWLPEWSAPAGEVFKATVVRAVAHEDDSGRLGQAVTHTYFVDPDIMTRYEGMPVVSLVSDYVNLFDDSTGIYVPGSAATNESEQNFMQDWRRTAHVEFIETGASTPAFADYFDIGIQGSTSRTSMQKGLHVLVGDSSASRIIEYPLFAARGTSASETTPFRRFILRGWGSCRKWPVLFSDAHHQTLAAHADIEIQDYRPAIVFINGEYWGLHELREANKNSWYHQFRTGIDRDDPGYDLLDEGGDVIDEGDDSHWQALWTYINSNDVSDDGVYNYITTRVDVENLARYISHCVISGKRDWPGQNESLWRPRTNDGRWRWTQFDMDLGLENWSRPQHDMVTQAVDGDSSGYGPHALFRALLANPEFERLFVNTCLDWLNSYFLTSVELAHFEALKAELDPFIAEFNNRWPIATDQWYKGWEGGNNTGRAFIQDRRTHRRNQLINRFNLGQARYLTLDTDPAMGRIRCNSVVVDETLPGADPAAPYPWQRSYYQNYPVELEAVPLPNHVFLGWIVKENGLPLPSLPDGDATYYSRAAVIDVEMSGTMTAEAVFGPVDYQDLHVWDFQNFSLSQPSYTVGGGLLAATPSVGGEIVLNAVAQGFESTHLRVNFPIGAQLEWSLPTTGHQWPRLRFLTRRSGQGAGTQHLSYTLDGVLWEHFDSYEVFDNVPQPRVFDFSGIEGTGDNPDFAVRIAFDQGSGGTAGNNRFDDVVLEVASLADYPFVTTPLADRKLIAGGESLQIDLAGHFENPGGGTPDFQVSNSQPGILATDLNGSLLDLSGLAAGEASLNVVALFDGHPTVAQSFRILVYPAPFQVASGSYRFGSWSAAEPTGSYPPHMIFLQSETSDPTRGEPLDRAYAIPSGDAAAAEDVEFPYAATSRTRINGLGDAGISFINTDRGRDVGSALLALDTTGQAGIRVKWTAGTVTPNDRIYALSLQYRLDPEAVWTDFPPGGTAVEYYRNPVAGHAQAFGPVALPAALENQPYVQLQWRYHYLSGSSGARAEIRLDDIEVSTGGTYDSWVAAEFSPEEAQDPAVSGPLASYAGDGVPNLIKYALGLGPAEPLGNDHLDLRANPDGSLSARFRLDRSLGDIVYQLQVSSDLDDWSGVVFDSSEDGGVNSEGGMHEVNVPPDGKPVRFLRLAVIRN